MLAFVARRLLYLVPVLVAVSLLTFLIASLLPGDLAYVILGDQATPEKVAALRHDMGLDQPVWWMMGPDCFGEPPSKAGLEIQGMVLVPSSGSIQRRRIAPRFWITRKWKRFSTSSATSCTRC